MMAEKYMSARYWVDENAAPWWVNAESLEVRVPLACHLPKLPKFPISY